MSNCPSIIRDPWRAGAALHCQKQAGHDGLHGYKVLNAAKGDPEVHWSGQSDYLVAKEQEREAKIAARRQEREAKRAVRLSNGRN